jgi:diguanylate cyclase (GGDEF)-like protein
VVRQSRATIDSRLSDIRRTLLLLLVGGALLAVPAFYFFGGRSLSRAHRAALRRAVSDGLTDLPNHRAFQDSLEREVALAQRHGGDLALALVDIDDFRFHNDSEGHAVADETLKRVGESLGGGRVEDQVFRTGGDEFAVILPRTSTEGALATIRNAAERLARVSSIEFSAGVVAVAPETEDADSLLSQADAALLEAKRRGGAQCSTFADVEDARLVTAAKVRAVRRMLSEGHMDAAYQPIFDIDGRRVLGYEGLARPAAGYGLNGPGEAFDVAGAIGRSPELDELCRRAVLRGARDLPEGTLLFMNVAPQSLDGERLAGDALAREARANGLEPERVVVEVTERFEGRIERVVSEARRLRTLGFKLALDDVGAGNSGLQMLRELEADFVKVDRAVVVGAVSDMTSRAVLVSMMAFARQTQALVVAEGIEDEEMLAMVRDPTLEGDTGLHAQAVQGYLLGRPGPLPARADSLAEQVLGSL